METKLYALIIGACAASILAGVAVGFALSSSTGAGSYQPVRVQAAVQEDLRDEVYDVATYTGNFAGDVSLFSPPEYLYVVTADNGFIIVLHAAGGVAERTTIPVARLPAGDRELVYEGIRIYTDEALVRILQDLGS